MADILIEGNATTRHNLRFGTALTVQVTGNNFYQFYGADDFGFAYRKSEDRMVTWQPEVTIFAGGATELVKAVIRFDKQTDGITGEFIHIFYIAGAPSFIEYRSLNTLTDVLSAAVPIGSGSVDTANNWSVHCISIVKTRADSLYAGGWVDTGGGGDNFLVRSTDNGLTWTAAATLTTMADGAAPDKIIFLPANLTDPDDFWCVYLRQSVPELVVKTYTALTNTWAVSAAFAGAVVVNSLVYFQMAATVRHSDGYALIAIWTHINNAAADLRVIEWDGTTGTFLPNVRDNLNAAGVAAISVDQATDDLYVGYLVGGVWEATVDVRWAVLPDNGLTWTDLPYSENAADDHRWISCDISPPPGGNFMLAWHNEDLDDVLTNIVNRVQFEAPPASPPAGAETPSGGSFNRLLSGSPGGFLTYITPDGRLYPLHTPHEFGRWVVSFSGFGTPPIQYITQRGPFQHGETVKDFFLRPRVIQLLIRQGFINRTAWWAGRASLLDEIRPNRQATATAALPGQLRIVETDGTMRDLNVFISEGPRFEPRIPTQWDEHAFQEVLRFIAHDPVAFDPTQVTATVTLGLAANLVFPITFPIQFGSGLVDSTLNINYLGTWLELPVITIVGPLEDVRIDNTTTGEKIELSADIAAGRTVTIDLREGFKTVVDDLGTNLIGIVTSDSDLATFHLAPDPEATGGVNAIRVRGTNPTGGTSVTLAYFDRYFGF